MKTLTLIFTLTITSQAFALGGSTLNGCKNLENRVEQHRREHQEAINRIKTSKIYAKGCS